jgi:hypothetical protein
MKDLQTNRWNIIIDRKGFQVAVMNLTNAPSRCTKTCHLVAETQICKGICISPRHAQNLLTAQDIEEIESYGFNPLGNWFVPGHVNKQENSSISYECKDGGFWTI